MTLREFFEDNLADTVAELCQYQQCDNCSIRGLFTGERCPLWDVSIEDALDLPVEPDR